MADLGNPLAAFASSGQRALLEPRIGVAALAVVLIVLYYISIATYSGNDRLRDPQAALLQLRRES